MRIAVGGIHIECSTFNPVLTHESEFRTVKGDALLEAPYFQFLRDYPATFLPTLHTRAIPGGPVARETYEHFKAEFLSRLQASLPIDGLYLAMHGAMYVEGLEDAEGDWITAARACVGDACPVAVSYDLHGNVTQRIIDAIDMYSTYRTAPHIDIEETMRRSVTMLVNSIQSGVRPGVVWAPVPVMLPGERTSTEDEPAKSLYATLALSDQLDGVLDSSLMVGYVWADEPRATAAAIFTGTDVTILKQQAAKLAQAYWDAREAFVFGCPTGSVAACVTEAINSATSPVILADSGDNPTGGGVGDRGDVLAELLRQQATATLVAGITDAPATQAAFAAGVGAQLTLTIGARLDPAGESVSARFTVNNLLPAGPHSTANQAVLQVEGITVVVADRRRPYHDLADFHALGLDPQAVNILVVKSGYLSPELAPLASPNLMALSQGVVDQDIERVPRRRMLTRTWPFDRHLDYAPQVFVSARAPFAQES